MVCYVTCLVVSACTKRYACYVCDIFNHIALLNTKRNYLPHGIACRVSIEAARLPNHAAKKIIQKKSNISSKN